MSVGVNVMFDIVQRLSKVLRDGYDVEITEMHHRWKKDAPSGTALRLKDAVEQAQPDEKWVEIFGRQGITGERRKKEIGIMSLKDGDVVGEHTVTFAGIGERLVVDGIINDYHPLYLILDFVFTKKATRSMVSRASSFSK